MKLNSHRNFPNKFKFPRSHLSLSFRIEIHTCVLHSTQYMTENLVHLTRNKNVSIEEKMKNNNPDLLFQSIIFRIKILENKKKNIKKIAN